MTTADDSSSDRASQDNYHAAIRPTGKAFPTCDGIVGVDTWRLLTGRPEGTFPWSVDSSRAFVISVDHIH